MSAIQSQKLAGTFRSSWDTRQSSSSRYQSISAQWEHLIFLAYKHSMPGVTCSRCSTSRPLSGCALRLLSSSHRLLRPLRRCNIGRPGRTLLLVVLLCAARLRILRAKHSQ